MLSLTAGKGKKGKKGKGERGKGDKGKGDKGKGDRKGKGRKGTHGRPLGLVRQAKERREMIRMRPLLISSWHGCWIPASWSEMLPVPAGG